MENLTKKSWVKFVRRPSSPRGTAVINRRRKIRSGLLISRLKNLRYNTAAREIYSEKNEHGREK